MRIADAGQDVPPFVFGAVVPLPPGVRFARASLVATTPAASGPPTPLAQATLTWVDAELPPDPGHLLSQTAYAQQVVIGTIDAPGGGGTTTKTFPLPAGCQGVGYIVNFVGFGNPNNVGISGVQSNRVYVSVGPIVGQPLDFQAVPVAAQDSSVTCSVTSGAQADHVVFLAFLYNPTSWVQSVPGTSLNVTAPTPAPWQAPLSQKFLAANVVSLGTAALIAAPGGNNQIYLFDARIYTTDAAGAFAGFKDTAGVNYGQGTSEGGHTGHVYERNYGGMPMGIGVGLNLFNPGGVASNLWASVSYTTAL